MRVAIIHDWLTGMRGGERCLEVFLQLYPEAELFTLIYQPERVTPIIRKRRVTSSFLNRLPQVQRYYRYLLPIFPQAANDLGRKLAVRHQQQAFDLVISISHCAAKNVPIPSGVPHFCYCLTPMRYIWDQFQAYFGGKKHEGIVKLFLPRLQRWDVEGAKSVTSFAAISSFIQSRITKLYSRPSDVVFPPVRSKWIEPRLEGEVGDGFLCVNALVPYKNVDVIVRAFNQLGEPLTIVGDGPEKARLQAIAGANIKFLSNLSDQQLAVLYRSSRALVFAAEEDFGMTPVEMQFAGRPVIAFGKGGALETVRFQGDRATGVCFSDLTTDAISGAVKRFIESEQSYKASSCLAKASQFTETQFLEQLQLWLGATKLNTAAKKQTAFAMR